MLHTNSLLRFAVRSLLVPALAFAILVGITSTSRASITVNSFSSFTDARIGLYIRPSPYDSYTGTDVPAHEELAFADPDASGDMTIDWSTAPGQTQLVLDFSHQRATFDDSWARVDTTVVFTPSVNVTYAMSGHYDLTGPGSTLLRAYLYDSTFTDLLFDNYQFALTSDQDLVLGEQLGQYDTLSGSVTGVLEAGKEYRLNFLAAIENQKGTADAGAFAEGEFTFTLTYGEAVPEPASLLAWSVLALTFGGAGWWRRRKH